MTIPLSPALQREVDRRTRTDQMRAIHEDVVVEELARIEAKVRRELDSAKQAQVIVDELGKLAMGSGTREYLSIALATEHRTILGQVMRAVAAAIVMTTHDDCAIPSATIVRHPGHDGRLTCETVAGAVLAQHQPII